MAQGFIVPDSDRITQGGGLTAEPLPSRPREPTPQTPAQATKDELEVEKLRRDLAKTPETDPELQSAIKNLGLDELLLSVKRGRDQVGSGWATGVRGALGEAAPWGGTTRKDFLGTLESLQGAIILEKLQALKEASKTGASGMGALSEREGQRLAAAVTAVNPDMSGPELEKSFDVIERHAKYLQAIAAGKNPEDEGVQKEFGIPPLPDADEDGRDSDRDDSGPKFTPSTGQTRSEIDPKMKVLGEKIAGIVNKGADRNTIMGFAVRADPALRDDPKFRAWLDEAMRFREKHPSAQFKVDPSFYTREIPLSLSEQNLNAAAQSAPGALAASAANAASLGLLDEAVGLTRGDQQRAQMTKEYLREQHPLASLLGEMGGGAAGVNLLGKLGRGALATDIGFGTAYGAGESNDNRLGGAALGAGAAFAGNRAGNYLGDLASAARDARAASRAGPREIFEAGQRQGIDVLPADVGGPFTRRMTAGAAQGPVSAIPVVRGAQRVTQQAQAARDRIASEVGDAGERELTGEMARQGADKFIKRTSKFGSDLYGRARQLASGAQVPLPRAIAKVDEHIAELERVPGGADAAGYLKELRPQLEGNFDVEAIRLMRGQMRDKFIKDGLRFSDTERRVNQVINAAADDIAEGLRAQGLGNAAGVYKQADRYWRMRLQTIDNVLEPIVGTAEKPKAGEQVMQAIESAAKGNNARLSSFVNALDPEEQANVRATIISNLGKASAGTSNAAGDAFSLPQFLTHWNQMTPGAKRTLFHGETRAALDDLAKVAEGAKEAQRYQNFSNTAGGITGSAILTGVPLYAGGLLGATGSMLAQYGGGRLLASPRFARWLVGAAKTNDAKGHIEKLSKIAGAESAIASELTGLRKALLSASNDNPATAPLAASEPEDGGSDD